MEVEYICDMGAISDQSIGFKTKLKNYRSEPYLVGAEKRTRTSTVLPPPGPEPGASTNSAISAFEKVQI